MDKLQNLEEELYLASRESEELATEAKDGKLVEVKPDSKSKPPKKKAHEVRERLEARRENMKVFEMSDGSEKAVFYPAPIHVYDDDTHAYEEIENTILEEDEKHFVCAKHRFTAKFSREEDNDELFSIKKGMHCVTVFSRKNKKNKNKGIIPKKRKNERAGIKDKDVLVYSDVETGADYEYSVEGDGVKENIVVKEKANIYRYRFTLLCKNVTAKLEEAEGRIAFISNETDEEVFYIPAPFMTDANGVVSADVTYGMRDAGNGEVHLTVTADSEFINAEERAFPVIIDPEIKLSGTSAMTTYSWNDDCLYNADTHTVGTTGSGDGNCNAHRMYISFKMPTLPRNPRIKKAELTIKQSYSYSACGQYPLFGLYHVTENIREGNYTPTHFSDLIDYAMMQSEKEAAYSFDITSIVDKVNKGEAAAANLVLKMLDETNVCNNYMVMNGSSSAYYPEISITYENTYAVNGSYRTHTHDIGRFGQGSIDLQCGNLMFESEDFAWSGNRMPVTIKHLYNSALSDCQYTSNSSIGLNTASFDAMKLGHGWKLNLMQSMVAKTFTHDDKIYNGYVYTDENGAENYFKKSDEIACKDNNCYYLFEDMDGVMKYDPEKCTLTMGDETFLFDAMGRLTKITDSFGNNITITYASNQITFVTDGAGREFEFSYNSSGFLTSIIAPDDTVISYGYTGNLLTDITYPDGKKAVIAYNSYKPASVTLKSSGGNTVYKIAYTFNGDRLIGVTEYGANGGIGASSDYSYSAASGRTIVTTTEQADEGESANNELKTVYTFDDEGNIVSEYAYSEDTGNVGTNGEASGINPYSGDGVGVVSNINNLLSGHNLESRIGWPELPGNCGRISVSNLSSETDAKYGKSALCIKSSSSECIECGVHKPINNLPAGQYTFSAYLRVKSSFSGTDSSGAYIRVIDMRGNILAESERLSMSDNEYTRLIAPFELKVTRSICVEILLDGKGTVYADAAQLENNPYANAYNMLENGSFEDGTTGWYCSPGVSCSTDTRFNMSKSLCMNGRVNGISMATHDIAAKGYASTRETFTLSGWAKGYGLPDHEREGVSAPCFRIYAAIYYSDGKTEFHEARFSHCTEEWQFASVQFAKKRYKTVNNIKICCDYNYNSGTVYFDNIQLVRNSIETNLSSSDFEIEGDGAENEAVAEATETTGTTDTAPSFNEAKDKFGNALTETTFTDGEFGTIYRSFGFNVDGNDLVRETDARGNDTTYSVDEYTSRNEQITDRLGNKTVYEYDTSGRTSRVISKNSSGTYIANVSYSYDSFDNMTEIIRGDGMKYVLAYNQFHNLESIGINGKPEQLIKYTYKNGNGRLKAMTYANGDTMKATYNSIGQMVAETWFDKNNVEKARYKYVYDGQGNIVRSIDILSEKEYNYEYEEGRIIRATECDIELSGEIITSKVVVNTIKYYYDSEGNMTKKVITSKEGTAHTVYYENTDDNTVVKFDVPDTENANKKQTITSHSKTDSFGRKVFDELQIGRGFVSRQFSYMPGAITEAHKENRKIKSTATTQLVSHIALSDGRTISYKYDDEERIIEVTDTIDGTVLYTYDALGQLETETKDGKTTKFEYDNYGNITAKAKGVIDEDGEFVEESKITYEYGNNVWKDLLTAYNGQSITYDAQGNPISYLGHTLTWEKGRQLKSYDSNTYTYNANGIRTSKIVNGVKHTYTLEGTKILREVWGTNTLIPLYDNEDSVCGIIYNNVPYYFLKNLQGDVIAIVDKDAQTVARYSYDAWGKCTITCDCCGIAAINPYRYRGYYYDIETKLYYLQSRHYNPEVGRFINADDILVSCAVSSVPNAFSYCLNNPICRSDHFGYAWRKTTNSSVNSFVDEIAQLIPNIYSDDILSRSSEIKILQLGCNTLSLTVSIGAAIQTNKNAIFGGMFKKGTLEVSAFLGINNYACFSFSAGINWKKAYIKIGFLVALSKKASGGYVGAYIELSIATWLLAVVTTAVAVVSIYSPAIAAYIAKLIAGIRSTARAMIPVLVPAIPKIVGALI